MKIAILFLAFAIIAQAKAAAPTTATNKVVIEKNIKVDSAKILLIDTLVTVRHDTISVFNTFKDTTKLIKSDTVRAKRIDTVWTKKYSRGK